MKQYNYSVIIPHYNCPLLLQRCLDSIPDREDIQVIIVDDNSSKDIVDFEHFPGINRHFTQIIFNKDSHGAGHARNLALPEAKGKWLLFADADDYFTPVAWETIGAYNDSEADIVYLNIQSVDNQTGEVLHDRGDLRIHNLKQYISTGKKEYEYFLRFWNNSPWAKMIRNDIVTQNNIIFGETKHANDTLFSAKTAIAAKSINASVNVCYSVTRTTNSLTQDMSRDAIALRYEVCLQKNELLRTNGWRKYQEPIHPYLRSLLKFGIPGIITFIRLSLQYKGDFIQSVYWYFKRKNY